MHTLIIHETETDRKFRLERKSELEKLKQEIINTMDLVQQSDDEDVVIKIHDILDKYLKNLNY